MKLMAKYSLNQTKISTWRDHPIVSLRVHLRYFLKRMTSFVFRPTDKQIFTGLGPWESVLFHWGCIYSSDICCMCSVLYQTGVQLLQHGSSSDRVFCELLHFPWPCIIIFAYSSAHSESCLVCVWNTSLRLINSSGVLNSGSLTSFITLLILPQCFWHLAHFSWISRCGSRDILA
jgi:hypothetical protein